MNKLLGTWVVPDESEAVLEYTIAEHQGRIAVSAVDARDGQVATVQILELADAHIAFVALWPSPGRESRCRLEIQGNGEALLTSTCTNRARCVRKRAASPSLQSTLSACAGR